MRYAGEGTQENPYIPADFTGFLHCISQAGCYVKLESDIDAAADPDYEGIIEEPVVFNCKICYADSLKKIIGVTVNTANAVQIPGGTRENAKAIRNIGFFNWSHKQISSSTAALIRIGNFVTMQGCAVSTQSAGSAISIFDSYSNVEIAVHRCSFHVKFAGANTGKVIAVSGGASVSFTRCNFILDGADIPLSLIGASFFCNNSIAFSQIGIVIKNSVLTNSEDDVSVPVFGSSAFSGFNYCVFEDSCISSLSSGVSLKTYSTNQGLTLFCTNGIENLSVEESANCKTVTEAQLKDADYLTEIGFFP